MSTVKPKQGVDEEESVDGNGDGNSDSYSNSYQAGRQVKRREGINSVDSELTIQVLMHAIHI